MLKVLVKGCEPSRGSKYSACVDLYSSEDVVIGAGETKLVGLGVCIDTQVMYSSLYSATGGEHGKIILEAELKRHYFQLMLRSSLGKKGYIIANGVGVIDLDYKEEIKISIHRPFLGSGLATFERKICKGDKIAQITLLEHKSYLFGIESDKERNGGFGSSDEIGDSK